VESPTRGGFIIARQDPTLSARVVRRVAMRYAAGADPATDRPAHVRAASGIAWVGAKVAVIQDDASFVALVDPVTGLADAVALPPGPAGRRLFDDGRGNKSDKLDHEALVAVATRDESLLVAVGSGSMPRRESIALLGGFDTSHPTAHVVAARPFYAALRASTPFAGSELNVEGAIYIGGGRLRLFGRGNGAERGAVRPVNATCEIDWPALRAHMEHPDRAPTPTPLDVVQYELGSIGQSRLTFTDATVGWPSAERSTSVYYSAAAEASPDVTRDGEVAGSAIGVTEHRHGTTAARWTQLTDGTGGRLSLKVEGIALAHAERGRMLAVVDTDAHDHPAELLEVQLEGSWPL
jgi:hypothetical protein